MKTEKMYFTGKYKTHIYYCTLTKRGQYSITSGMYTDLQKLKTINATSPHCCL